MKPMPPSAPRPLLGPVALLMALSWVTGGCATLSTVRQAQGTGTKKVYAVPLTQLSSKARNALRIPGIPGTGYSIRGAGLRPRLAPGQDAPQAPLQSLHKRLIPQRAPRASVRLNPVDLLAREPAL